MQCPRFAIYFGFSFLPCSAAVRAQHIRRLPKGCRACQTLIISSSLCLPLRPASRIRLQIPSSKAFPHPFVPSPGPARTAALRPQFALEASKCDFLAFQKSSYFLLPFFLEKNAKIMDFGLPKPSRNPIKMPSKSMSHKTCIFSSIFCLFWLFSALCAFSSKCLKPNKKLWFCCITSISALCVCRNIKQRENIEKTYQKPSQNEVRTL